MSSPPRKCRTNASRALRIADAWKSSSAIAMPFEYGHSRVWTNSCAKGKTGRCGLAQPSAGALDIQPERLRLRARRLCRRRPRHVTGKRDARKRFGTRRRPGASRTQRSATRLQRRGKTSPRWGDSDPRVWRDGPQSRLGPKAPVRSPVRRRISGRMTGTRTKLSTRADRDPAERPESRTPEAATCTGRSVPRRFSIRPRAGKSPVPDLDNCAHRVCHESAAENTPAQGSDCAAASPPGDSSIPSVKVATFTEKLGWCPDYYRCGR